MKCVICKNGDTTQGQATMTLEKNKLVFIVRNVPAQICSNCGEEYFDEATTNDLLKTASATAKTGAQVEIREYRAA